MPGNAFELYPAKQTVKGDGKASLTILNQSSHSQTFTTKTMLLQKGCNGSAVSGLNVPTKIKLAANQSKTIHFTVNGVHGSDVGIIVTPAQTGSGFHQSASVGAQVLTSASAVSCVKPVKSKAAADTGPGGLSATALLICLLGVVFLITAAVLVSRRHRGSHRAR
jgi:hypothetical protein